MSVFIIASVFTPLMQSMQNSPLDFTTELILESIIDCIFTVEVVVRFVVYPTPSRIFLCNPFNVVDTLAGLLPFALRLVLIYTLLVSEEQAQDVYLHVIILCIVPVLRLLKTLRHFEKFQLLLTAFEVVAEALPVLAFTLMVVLLSFSSLMFLAEDREDMPALSHALWLCIMTMTTVGYGDMYPISMEGKVIAGCLAVVSMWYMAMPLGIIGEAFSSAWINQQHILLKRRVRRLLIQWGYTARDVVALLPQFSRERPGELNVHEFRRMIRKMKIVLKDSRVIDLFQALDDDGSGSINAREVVKALFPNEHFAMYGADGGGDSSCELGISSMSSTGSLMQSRDHVQLSRTRTLESLVVGS
eukprot:gnl/TRDRNA2_/TRDRNA2_176688_c3_seq1.p1 gnl/TRDRNA2_/TRDRNA2_176688_c3~~gnl/TRDRNA2_/TRDRNA2_176688_c3_seq1.p1  ORF type:complete len:368 (-),score=30.13 gnl/TRDRNA2_/TRDRNA2_176688_c3_seq1:270-1346(-)